MAKPMKLRDLETALLAADCKVIRDTGNHTVWGLPVRQAHRSGAAASQISPGVISKLVQLPPCLPKGWLG